MFLEKWLPVWAKESVLKENRALRRRVRRLERELELEKAYCRGLRYGAGRKRMDN